jgi:hypothetical protein
MNPKYDIEVKLIGEDGNIFNLISIVTRAMKKHKVKGSEREAFLKDIHSASSYDEALQKIMKWVHVS